jgi:hypothetical protein
MALSIVMVIHNLGMVGLFQTWRFGIATSCVAIRLSAGSITISTSTNSLGPVCANGANGRDEGRMDHRNTGNELLCLCIDGHVN